MLSNVYNFILYVQSIASMNYFKDLVSDGPSKFFYCLGTGIISWIAGSFAPIWMVLLIVTLLIFTDAFLGCRVSTKAGNPCDSRRLWTTIKKLCWCSAFIWFGCQIDTHILVSFNAHLVEFFAGIISGVELWSVVENLNSLDPTGPWKIFSKFIKTKGEKYLDITIDKNDLPKIKKLCKKIK